MDEKLTKETDQLKDSGIKIAEIKTEIAKLEQRIYDLSRVIAKKGQFESVIKAAQNNIDELKKNIQTLEEQLVEIGKTI